MVLDSDTMDSILYSKRFASSVMTKRVKTVI